jgi:hypothetical protein
VAIYDAMDGPTYASLREAVRDRRISGCAFLVVGVLCLVALLAAGETYEAVASIPMAAFFGAAMWWLTYRTRLRDGLTAPAQATDRATYVSTPWLRLIAAAMVVGASIAVFWAFGSAPSAFIPLGFAASELAAAAKLRGWERRDGRTLFRAGTQFFAR